MKSNLGQAGWKILEDLRLYKKQHEIYNLETTVCQLESSLITKNQCLLFNFKNNIKVTQTKNDIKKKLFLIRLLNPTQNPIKFTHVSCCDAEQLKRPTEYNTNVFPFFFQFSA